MNPKISIIKNFLISFRINNWIKNLLVFSALLFSKNLLHSIPFLNTLYVFIIFCFLSSTIYLLNDVIDIKNDNEIMTELHSLIDKNTNQKEILIHEIILTKIKEKYNLLTKDIEIKSDSDKFK